MSGPLALYVHWPFCESKCPYCDFNSHVAETIDHDQWCDALLAELSHYAVETPGRTLTSLYFGGGTPSLMVPQTVGALIEAAARHWGFADKVEITLEANPSSAEIEKFRDFRAAGVGRLSLGVQSLKEESLAYLGRRHDAKEARQALADAASTFERFSFDLIYGLPGQSVATWQSELGEALALAGDHLSVYQLTIEPGTVFFREGRSGAPEDLAADLFDATREQLSAAGFPAYEVSNHARPGGESRHNLTYWQGGEYIGIGPGAHGRLVSEEGFVATHQVHEPERWLELTQERGHGDAKWRILAASERAEEMIMTGLRLTNGLDTAHVEQQCGVAVEQLLDRARLDQCVKGGLLEWRARHLVATESGMPRLNAILAALLAPETDPG